jgi:fumarylacetoacetase
MTLKTSWVASANSATTDFPLNNLPYGVFSLTASTPRCGVAIGDMILDVAACEEAGLISLEGGALLQSGVWNPVMKAGASVWTALRARLTELLAEGSADQAALEGHLVPMADAELHMPFTVSEYTDFYAGKEPRVQRGHDVPRRGKCFACQLVVDPNRLQRARVVCGDLRHPRDAAMGSAEGAE